VKRIDDVEVSKEVMITRKKILGGNSLEIALANKK